MFKRRDDSCNEVNKDVFSFDLKVSTERVSLSRHEEHGGQTPGERGVDIVGVQIGKVVLVHVRPHDFKEEPSNQLSLALVTSEEKPQRV